MVARKTAMVAPRLFQRHEPSDQASTPVYTTPRPTGRPRKKNVRPLHTLTSMSDWKRAFSTRKRTLMSKAYELEVATGSVVTITVHAPTGEIHYYANDDVRVEGLKKAKLVSDDSKRYTQHCFADQVTNRISMIQNLFQSPPDVTRISAASTEDNPYSFNHLLSPFKTSRANRNSSLDSDGQCKKKAFKSKNTSSQSTFVDGPLGSDDQCKKTVLKEKKSIKSKTTVSRATSVDSPLGSDNQYKKNTGKSQNTGSRDTSVKGSSDSQDRCKKKAVKGKKSFKTKNSGSQSSSVDSPLDSDNQFKKKAVKRKKSVKSKKIGSAETSVKSKLKFSTDPPKAINIQSEAKTVVDSRPKTSHTRVTRDMRVKSTIIRKRPNSSSILTTSPKKVPKRKMKSASGLTESRTKRAKRTKEKTCDDDRRRAASLPKSPQPKRDSLAENAKRSTLIKQSFGKSNKEEPLYDFRKQIGYQDRQLSYGENLSDHQRENVPPNTADCFTREELCKQVRDEFDEKLSEPFLAQDVQLHRYVTKLESMRIPMCPINMLYQVKSFRNLSLNIKRHTGHLSINAYKTFLRDALLKSNVVDVVGKLLIKRKSDRSKSVRWSHIRWASNN